MRKFILAAMLLLLVALPAESSATYAADVPSAKIDEIFARYDKPDSPGVMLAVIRDGQIAYQRGYGMANLEHDVPLAPESVFYIASTSKQFTAACIALLIRQGKIALDDDVRKHVTELPDYGAPLKIHHLVHHTSGLRDYLGLLGVADKTSEGFSGDDAVRLIVRQKELNFPPGEEYSYTNSGYALMAAIVKRTSGLTLRQFAQKHIFEPLGMQHSVFRDDNTLIIKHRATGYMSKAGGFRTADPGIESVGSGNLWTTTGDLLRWDQNFYQNRLGDGFLELLHTPGKLNNGHTLDYCFGLVVDKYKGLEREHHGGAFDGFRTQLVRFPRQRLSIICLANLGNVDPDALANQVADLYLADQFPPQSAAAELPDVKLSAESLAALAGTFRDARDGVPWTFVVDGDTLAFEQLTPSRTRLQPTGETSFRGTGPLAELACEFVAPTDGNPKQVKVRMGDGPDRVLQAATLEKPSAEVLQEYAGSYYSEEADAMLTLAASNELLLFESPGQPRKALRPSVRDEFTSSAGVLQFERAADGKVTALRFNSPRIRKLRFAGKSD